MERKITKIGGINIIPLAECLAKFTGSDIPHVLDMLRYRDRHVRADWAIRNPVTPADYEHFYRTTWGTLWDMASWHVDEMQQNFDAEVVDKIASFKPRLVLDYGCGIGVLSIMLAEMGIRSVAYDYRNPALNFCQYWTRKSRLDHMIEVVDSKRYILGKRFDIAVCMDVIEHLPNPAMAVELAEELTTYAPIVLYNINLGRHLGWAPMHLEEDDELLEKLEGILNKHNAKTTDRVINGR